VEPVLATVSPGSPAALAGLQAGDRIVRANGEEVRHSMDVVEHMRSSAEPVSIAYQRDGTTTETTLVPRSQQDGRVTTGLEFQPVTVRMGANGPFQAVASGTGETFRTLGLTIRSIALLFGGVDVTQAVAGPLRISYYVGEVATQGFSTGFGTGLRSVFNFLSLLSVALFFMNLLPIPILDGGQIVLYGIEWGIRRPIHPKAIYWYQMVGMVLVFGLILFALFGDILFLSRQG
jgi:regulator of sigma E protease